MGRLGGLRCIKVELELRNAMPMRAVIYARYSSENQREASIEDQREICRRYIERQGWTLSDSYEDPRVSGPAASGRPCAIDDGCGGQQVRFRGLRGDRPAGPQARRRRRPVRPAYLPADAGVHATSIGLLTQMHVGIMGTMAQMTFRTCGRRPAAVSSAVPAPAASPAALPTATRWCLRHPAPGGGRARDQVPQEAEIVRRIFREFAAGKSPRHIAHDLNAEQIPGPDGRPWGDTTIRGQPDRGTGLLNNTLYIGRLSWNRCSYVKDPRTGRRIARINDRAQWEEVEVPHLRIIEPDLWDAQRAPAGHAAPDRRGYRRQRAEPCASPGLPAQRPVGLRLLRWGLHDHGEEPLRLCDAPRQGHLRERIDHHPPASRAPCPGWAARAHADAGPRRGVCPRVRGESASVQSREAPAGASSSKQARRRAAATRWRAARDRERRLERQSAARLTELERSKRRSLRN